MTLDQILLLLIFGVTVATLIIVLSKKSKQGYTSFSNGTVTVSGTTNFNSPYPFKTSTGQDIKLPSGSKIQSIYLKIDYENGYNSDNYVFQVGGTKEELSNNMDAYYTIKMSREQTAAGIKLSGSQLTPNVTFDSYIGWNAIQIPGPGVGHPSGTLNLTIVYTPP